MNFITMGLGILPIIYAVYVIVLRKQGKDEKFKKLGPMKEKYGEKFGSIIHYMGYVLAPFIVGVIIIYAGFNGLNITDII